MPLRFDLGPFEKLYIGRSVLTNSHQRTCFVLEGDTPILRAKDFLQPSAATNSLEQLYCCIQQMYLEAAPASYQGSYLRLMVQATKDEPSLCSELNAVDGLVTGNKYYKALKDLKKLIRPSAFAVYPSESKGLPTTNKLARSG
ncbi:flagellar biosynthesis repressor FlbT [Bradyrhizobium sp. ARR65]|uniref:flagellar biosynthesis repressor FlbT n=1 Tax=Bradyrhizobium sp. ARR65 TaxID=1040989 RepID=UPI00046445AD|nr:flagellar biosynthesis repressor FlbT [Bradyrhizobium sp. ARR65]